MILTKENIKSIDLDNLIDEKIKGDQLHSFLLVVPTNRKLRALKKEIITLSPRQVTTNIMLETLGTFSKRMLERTIQFHELSEAASAVFIEQSAQKIEMKYFTNYKGTIPSGTLERIVSVISKYKEEGITPDLLRREADKLNKSERLKALDIANIYAEYNKKCFSLNAYELGDVYQNLASLKQNKFSEEFRKLYPEAEIIVFNGFDEFTELELSIINKLSFVKDLKLFINFDYFAYNPMIFSHLEETYEKLQRFGFKKIEDKSKLYDSNFLDVVKSRLFLKSSKQKEEYFEKKLISISSESREKEVKYIAKEVKQLLLSEAAKPHEICVTFNLINNYSSLVRDIFHVYGIPFNLTDRITLDQSLSVTAIISFLEIAENDYYYKNIVRSLSNSFIEIEEFDLDALLFAAKNLKIIVGRDNWNFNLINAIGNLKLNSDENDNTIRIEKYEKAFQDLEKLDSYLFPFQRKLSPSKFVNELNKLIQKLNIAPKLLNAENQNKENDIKGLTTFINSVEEIFLLFESEHGDEKHNLAFYLDRIRTLSQTARFNIKERSDYGVLITNIDEIRGLKFKYTFLGGMIDGDFPTKYQPEIFFSGSFAKKERHHLNEERYRFYQALKSWDRGFYLTYPTSQGEKETVKSTFLDEFDKCFAMSYKTSDDYDNLIFSAEELQRNIWTNEISLDKNKDNSIAANIEEWKKAVKIDQFRNENPLAPSSYNGSLFADSLEEEETLKTELLNMQTKAYSVSQLETYTACPFRYFLERVLKVEIVEEPDEEMEAVEIGSLLHAILFEFYVTVRKKNIIIRNCSDNVFKIAEDLIFEIAEKRVSETTHNSPFAFFEEEKILGINSERKNSLLYKFLLYEREDNSNRIPNYFEVSFGLKDSEHDELLYSDEPLNYDGVRLRGKIDRIDVNKNSNTFEVIDYKSGSKKVTKAEIEKGTSLQLPVYIWAVKTLLSEKLDEEYLPKAMSIYNLKFQEGYFGRNSVSLSRKKDFDPTEALNELVEIALEHVKKSVDNILEGNFPLTQFLDDKEKICRYCNFNTICRIDELVK
ncbi:ATP-dependent nuclease, subunit B [hydrothermal vent metagenome]|uniref:ATP-dependent nuclease, subunit B n=1 Tax=hydrothermal vent metagenome TaxID=652676 RepID=A0A3B1BYJ7_9ZZZZ